MKIMSNEQLVVSYRDALKSGTEKEWVWILKKEIVKRGLKPIKKQHEIVTEAGSFSPLFKCKKAEWGFHSAKYIFYASNRSDSGSSINSLTRFKKVTASFPSTMR